MAISPPCYEFTASTAQEAKNLLQAAQNLLDAHMVMLAPGDGMVRHDLLKRTPVALTIHLDLTQVVGTANEVSALSRTVDL
mgnify:CR=1 FL=1